MPLRNHPRTNWSAHISIPIAIFNAPLRKMLASILVAAILTAMLTLVFIWLIRQELIEQRRESERHERAVRMEALGRMTGGVAHDFNNLLMVIQGNAEILMRRFRQSEALRFVEAIKKSAERASHLTKDLLSFSRGEGGRREVVDLHARIESIKGMLRQSLPSNIHIEFNLTNEAAVADIDPIQFDLAILNIVVNARDAMPDGGILSLGTSKTAMPGQPTVRAIALCISDTGSGVSEDVLPHVFEPFFSTKTGGKGTGLGLSQVYGFAKGVGGIADIESRVGRGTTVTLYLPEATTAVTKPEERVFLTVVGKKLLLVDDNPEVRAVTASLLCRDWLCRRPSDKCTRSIGETENSKARPSGFRRGHAR